MKATCIKEPRGDKGLEGYQLGDIYNCEGVRVVGFSVMYYRVWPAGDCNDETNDDKYYETCSVKTFNKYFEAIK